MIGIPDSELGELGRLMTVWANGQQFPPTQRAIARKLGVSNQQVAKWLRGQYAVSLKPVDVRNIAQMMAGGQDSDTVYLEVLNAVLRDIGLLPKRGVRDQVGERRAR